MARRVCSEAIISDSFLANGSEPSPKQDNVWLQLPCGVALDVVRGRKFGDRAGGEAWLCEDVHAKRVYLVSSGNDLKTTTGSRTRSHLPQAVLDGVRTAVKAWQTKAADVVFVFLGDWASHGAGFADHDTPGAKDRYDSCRSELLRSALDAGAVVMEPPLAPLAPLPMVDEWHFASGAALALRGYLLDYVLIGREEAAFQQPPQPKKQLRPPPKAMRTLADFDGATLHGSQYLSITRGQFIFPSGRPAEGGWSHGTHCGEVGWYPSHHAVDM
jgi:hypothetical protein